MASVRNAIKAGQEIIHLFGVKKIKINGFKIADIAKSLHFGGTVSGQNLQYTENTLWGGLSHL